MNKLYGIAVPLFAGLLSGAASGVPDKIGDFALLDTYGGFHQLSRYRNKEALVLMSFEQQKLKV